MGRTIPRVVFDCNILWRAFYSRLGTGYKCYRLIVSDQIVHFTSKAVIDELLEVLLREEVLERYPEYDSEDVRGFVKYIASMSVVLDEVPHVVELPRDRDDEHYLNLAIAAEADFLVSNDNDLLDLMTGIDLESKQFRQRFRHLKIVKPDEFLSLAANIDLSLRS